MQYEYFWRFLATSKRKQALTGTSCDLSTCSLSGTGRGRGKASETERENNFVLTNQHSVRDPLRQHPIIS